MTDSINIRTNNFLSPNYYSDTTNNQLFINDNLVGQDTTNFALNANYNAMNSQYQIPLTDINVSLANYITSSDTAKIRAITFINANQNQRTWNFSAIGLGNATGTNTITFAILASTYSLDASQIINNLNEAFNVCSFTQSLFYSGSSTIKEDTIITANKSSGIPTASINNLSMFTTPQRFVTPISYSGQQAVDILSVGPFKPIFSAPSNENSSIAGIAKTINYTKSNVIPNKAIFGVFSPYEMSTGVTNYAGSEVNAFDLTGSTYTTLAFATANNVTQSRKSVDWYAYVGVQDASQPGRFEITTSFTSTGSTFSNTVPAWISGSITIDTENLSSSATIQSSIVAGLSGNLTYKLRKTVSTNTANVSVWSFQLFEGSQ